MWARSAFFVVAVLAACGCDPKVALVPGTWNFDGGSLQVNPDGTWTTTIAEEFHLAGTWRLDSDDVTLTPTTVNGQDVETFKGFLKQKEASRGDAARQFAEDIDKPDTYTLSADGKTMTIDRSMDINTGAVTTLTKL
jgi:hypothetical protein